MVGKGDGKGSSGSVITLQVGSWGKYRDNVKKLSKAFRDRPSSPLETAVWWIEYVGRGNGLAYIRSDAVEQPWWPSFRLLREVQPFTQLQKQQ
ncbi:hypothetical protein M0804_000342 [Polistes exclamans]|nr:hypothetical protein M0804_000342 [Polistes exclamans]